MVEINERRNRINTIRTRCLRDKNSPRPSVDVQDAWEPASGKTKNEIMKELGISESQLKFQLDYLVKECYAEVDGENVRLNLKGLDELLANIK